MLTLTALSLWWKQKRAVEARRSLGERYGVRLEAKGKTANPFMSTPSTEVKGVLVRYLYFRICSLCSAPPWHGAQPQSLMPLSLACSHH